MNKGSYLIILKLPEEIELRYGENTERLEKGFYVYVGSAMNSLTGRVKYHLSDNKKGKWHIDKLIEVSDVEYVILIPSKWKLEEKISNTLVKNCYLEVVKNFGSSDVKTKGNLFFVRDKRFFEKIFEILNEVKK